MGKSPVSATQEQRGKLAALDARAHWRAVGWLAKYAPQLNDIDGLDQAFHNAEVRSSAPQVRPYKRGNPCRRGRLAGTGRGRFLSRPAEFDFG